MRSISMFLVFAGVGFLQIASARAQATVSFELMTERGFPISGAQEWSRMLGRAGIDNVQIRSARSGDEGKIENRGTEGSPRYHVKGFLSANNTMRLPGATFGVNDRVKIVAWVERLKTDGIENLFAKKGAFGLTGKQLVGLHRQLSTKLTIETKGKPAGDVAKAIADSLPVNFTVSSSARTALAGQETVAEELMGMSGGTALAAVLRPLGLVMVPQRPSGGSVRIAIMDARNADEIWPVGWPSEKNPRETMPDLFQFIEVEIEDFIISDALAAVQDRLKVPFLYDHNSMARHGVDLTNQKATLPTGRSYYKKIIDRLLAKSKPQMKSELRVDEAGRPFLWLTTVKR